MTAPAPTLATATVDYIPAGVRRYTFVPTIANPAAPTKSELSAGTDYTPAINGITGFNLTADTVDNSNFGSAFNSTIEGVQSVDDSSWTLKASKTGTDARTLLAIHTVGFVVIYDEGLTTTGKMDVWPVRIRSSNIDQVARDNLATITVQFAIPAPPVQNLSVPTS